MGNAMKKVADCTLNFFGKVKDLISKAFHKVSEVMINGVKKIVSFFKKIIEYSWNGVKIVGKLLYCAGKQLIHTLTGKSGIPYLIEFYNELVNKNVQVKDEKNNFIKPFEYFNNAKLKMEEGDQIKVKTEIIKNNSEYDRQKPIEDFADNDEEDLQDILGLEIKDGVAKVGDSDISIDSISNADTDSNFD